MTETIGNIVIKVMDNWIDVNDRLPEIDEFVLFCCADNGYMQVDHIDKDMDVPCWLMETFVTHWQPLPSPPNVAHEE
ncbi:MAG: DUF551 domain-containing protein [Colwellia sp.]|nr:DUF551 domain-containing protein [Colwellia sp.]